MPAILTGLAGKAFIALGGLALVLGALLYVRHLRSSLATAQANVATLTSANLADVKAMKAYQAQVKRNQDAQDHLAEKLKASESSRAADDAAIDAQAGLAGQDGPVAPVLANALDRLRGEQP